MIAATNNTTKLIIVAIVGLNAYTAINAAHNDLLHASKTASNSGIGVSQIKNSKKNLTLLITTMLMTIAMASSVLAVNDKNPNWTTAGAASAADPPWSAMNLITNKITMT